MSTAQAQAAARAALPQGLDVVDARIIDRLQDGVPLVPYPFAEVATELELNEDDLLARIRRLLHDGFATRFGPLINADAAGGAYMLAALAVPEERFEEVADIVNGFEEVAHNYAREHRFNMWFVLAAASRRRVEEVADAIEQRTGLTVLRLPKLREYFVDFRVRLLANGDCRPSRPSVMSGKGTQSEGQRNGNSSGAAHLRQPAAADPLPGPPPCRGRGLYDGTEMISLEQADRALLAAMQAGLKPALDIWAQAAARAGQTAEEVLRRLRRLHEAGVIRRIALVPNHFRLGFRANGMTVWDVDDARIDELGERIGALPFVSHCYQRPRQPGWPYNLFAMVHGRSVAEMQAQVARVAQALGDAVRAHEVLRSTRILKKTGVRLFDSRGSATAPARSPTRPPKDCT